MSFPFIDKGEASSLIQVFLQYRDALSRANPEFSKNRNRDKELDKQDENDSGRENASSEDWQREEDNSLVVEVFRDEELIFSRDADGEDGEITPTTFETLERLSSTPEGGTVDKTGSWTVKIHGKTVLSSDNNGKIIFNKLLKAREEVLEAREVGSEGATTVKNPSSYSEDDLGFQDYPDEEYPDDGWLSNYPDDDRAYTASVPNSNGAVSTKTDLPAQLQPLLQPIRQGIANKNYLAIASVTSGLAEDQRQLLFRELNEAEQHQVGALRQQSVDYYSRVVSGALTSQDFSGIVSALRNVPRMVQQEVHGKLSEEQRKGLEDLQRAFIRNIQNLPGFDASSSVRQPHSHETSSPAVVPDTAVPPPSFVASAPVASAPSLSVSESTVRGTSSTTVKSSTVQQPEPTPSGGFERIQASVEPLPEGSLKNMLNAQLTQMYQEMQMQMQQSAQTISAMRKEVQRLTEQLTFQR